MLRAVVCLVDQCDWPHWPVRGCGTIGGRGSAGAVPAGQR